MARSSIYDWTKKIHMYSGLFTFTAFVVWGITGVEGMFLPPPGEFTPPPVSSVREFSFKASGAMDDKQLARAIHEAAAVPLAGGHYNIHRDKDSNLAFNVFTINGGREVTFHEDTGIVKVAHRANSTLSYLSSMHTAHSRRHKQHPAVSAWGYFNEFSNWAFLFMTLSGVYMWIATRPGMNWARWILAASIASAAILWFMVR